MDAELRAILEDSLRRFGREREAGDGTQGPSARWREIVDRGWLDLPYVEPSAANGIAVEPVVPVFTAAGEGLWREPLGVALGAGVALAARAAKSDLREALAAGMRGGTRALAICAREAGSGPLWPDGPPPATRAATADTAFRIDGTKLAVCGTDTCIAYAVLAHGPDGPAWYLVDRGAPGVSLECRPGVDGRALATVRFSAAPAERLCGGEATGPAAAWGSILAAAEAVGMMRGAIADTVGHLRQRTQFGRALIDFQALRHRLVEMHMLERETSALLGATAACHDGGYDDLGRRVLVLRAQASRALGQVTREAVQMHGGMGMTRALRIGHYFRRALMLDSLYGSEDWALATLASA